MISAFLAALGLANLVYLLHTKKCLEKKLAALERVGVVVSTDKHSEVMAKPMSPREKIRWVERRMNGSLRATP